LAGTLVAYSLAVWWQLGAATKMTGGFQAIADEQVIHAVACNSPKLVYVAGSSGFYGVRCGLSKEYADRPGFNMSLHAGLGARFLLDRARLVLKRGDLVVVGFEYELYEDPEFPTFACDFILSRDPDYFRSAPLWQQLRLVISAGPIRIAEGLVSKVLQRRPGSPSGACSRDGDRLIPEGDTQSTDLATCLPVEAIVFRPSSRITQCVAEFVDWCRRNGVEVVAVPPPRCVKAFSQSSCEDVASRVTTAMRAYWSAMGVSLLCGVDTTVYPETFALDTHYHIQPQHSADHTAKIFAIINDYLSGVSRVRTPVVDDSGGLNQKPPPTRK
jgi:hypothetical protein